VKRGGETSRKGAAVRRCTALPESCENQVVRGEEGTSNLRGLRTEERKGRTNKKGTQSGCLGVGGNFGHDVN